MASNDLEGNPHKGSFQFLPSHWSWYLTILLVVGTVEPLVGSVRSRIEPHVGHWLAYAMGILAAGAIAFPIYGVVTWVIRREQSKQSNGIATMLYRPAALPSVAFIGAIMDNFPNAVYELATYGFLIGMGILLAVAVILQKRQGRPWNWPVALLVGFGIAIFALLAAGSLSLAFGQRS